MLASNDGGHCAINDLIDETGYNGGELYVTHDFLPGAVLAARTVRKRKKRDARN
jgi:hypothetical protein